MVVKAVRRGHGYGSWREMKDKVRYQPELYLAEPQNQPVTRTGCTIHLKQRMREDGWGDRCSSQEYSAPVFLLKGMIFWEYPLSLNYAWVPLTFKGHGGGRHVIETWFCSGALVDVICHARSIHIFGLNCFLVHDTAPATSYAARHPILIPSIL